MCLKKLMKWKTVFRMAISEALIGSLKPLSLISNVEKCFSPSCLLIVVQVTIFLENSCAMLELCELVNRSTESRGEESDGK